MIDPVNGLEEISNHMRAMMEICSTSEVGYYNRMRKTAIEAISVLEKQKRAISELKQINKEAFKIIEEE